MKLSLGLFVRGNLIEPSKLTIQKNAATSHLSSTVLADPNMLPLDCTMMHFLYAVQGSFIL